MKSHLFFIAAVQSLPLAPILGDLIYQNFSPVLGEWKGILPDMKSIMEEHRCLPSIQILLSSPVSGSVSQAKTIGGM